jgi:uncharacterized protein (DUF488 family)
LLFLQKQIGSLRGNDLLRKAYLEYPYYATRSSIVSNVLAKKDYQLVLTFSASEKSPNLFTLGYEGISIDKYLNILISHNIFALVDVRKNPISHKFGFSKNQLKRYVENIGCTYFHFPELGVPSNLRQNLSSEQAYTDLFVKYAEEILPANTEALGRLQNIIEENRRVALTCFEENFVCCHRSKITEYFANDSSFSFPITHL